MTDEQFKTWAKSFLERTDTFSSWRGAAVEAVQMLENERAKNGKLIEALKDASKRSTYEWTDGYNYFPSDHANEGRIALANELITIIEVHNEGLEK